jgi:AcrR family transcriptional regulator
VASVPTRAQRDGRVERGNRTRRAIVEAHVELLREGDLLPTAARVAERAGVSVRTLWAAFGDMEGLLRATTGYWFELDDALRGEVDPTLTLEERIVRFCAERVRRLENISPAARAALLKEPFSEALRASRLGHVERVVHDIEAAFATELDAAPDRPALLDALVAATSWNAWSLLRDDLGRSVDAAHAAMLTTLHALLPPPSPTER